MNAKTVATSCAVALAYAAALMSQSHAWSLPN